MSDLTCTERGGDLFWSCLVCSAGHNHLKATQHSWPCFFSGPQPHPLPALSVRPRVSPPPASTGLVSGMNLVSHIYTSV